MEATVALTTLEAIGPLLNKHLKARVGITLAMGGGEGDMSSACKYDRKLLGVSRQTHQKREEPIKRVMGAQRNVEIRGLEE